MASCSPAGSCLLSAEIHRYTQLCQLFPLWCQRLNQRPFYLVNKYSTTDLRPHPWSVHPWRTAELFKTLEHKIVVVYQGNTRSLAGCLEKCRGWSICPCIKMTIGWHPEESRASPLQWGGSVRTRILHPRWLWPTPLGMETLGHAPALQASRLHGIHLGTEAANVMQNVARGPNSHGSHLLSCHRHWRTKGKLSDVFKEDVTTSELPSLLENCVTCPTKVAYIVGERMYRRSIASLSSLTSGLAVTVQKDAMFHCHLLPH